jgi:acetyltransferase
MPEALEGFEPLFNPRSIAFIGATRNKAKWGFMILSNILLGGYKGKVYPINPNEDEDILGLKVYPTVYSLPESPDLAVIVIPQSAVSQTIKECVDKRIKASLVITSGFAEVAGEERKRAEVEMVEIARKGGMILVGPNSNGIASTPSDLNILMSLPLPPFRKGSLAITSRSGSVGTSVLRRSIAYNIGFSRYASNGNEADLHIEDYIEYFGEDPQTKTILAYTEGIQQGRKFLEIATKVSRKKPITMLMSGVTEAGARAARYHTASFYYGRESTYQAICKQAGIIRANDIAELFNIGASFLAQPLPRGRRVAILTMGGGWGVVASDTCVKAGLEVVELPDETYKELNRFLPWWWSHNNPVDTATGFKWEGCLEALTRCPAVDAILLLTGTGRGVMPIGEIAPAIRELIDQYNKPIILCSETREEEAIKELGQRDLIPYPSISQAVKALASLVSYSEYLASI